MESIDQWERPEQGEYREDVEKRNSGCRPGAATQGAVGKEQGPYGASQGYTPGVPASPTLA